MTQREFARFFKEHMGGKKTFSQAEKDIKGFMEALERVFRETEEDSVIIPGYGQFILQTRRPRKIRHPKTHEIVIIPERKQVVFKPSSKLYVRVNNK